MWGDAESGERRSGGRTKERRILSAEELRMVVPSGVLPVDLAYSDGF